MTNPMMIAARVGATIALIALTAPAWSSGAPPGTPAAAASAPAKSKKAATRRDPGLNQPGAAGNRGATPGVAGNAGPGR